MKNISKTDISTMDKVRRLNLINSCTGYKSANLIATKSVEGIANVAVFSSITHLGSNPAMLGFIVRPTTVPRDTYKNIKETGFFTVNHISSEMIADAHHTSASYD
ncbi:MAG: flavin reductase, partial [Flavobacterium sp.]|nr:flavin reductase [Flavobacterium sp.]